MKKCWFCRYDIHRPPIFSPDQRDRPAYEVEIEIHHVKKKVFICEFCHNSVNSSFTNQGHVYSKKGVNYDRY